MKPPRATPVILAAAIGARMPPGHKRVFTLPPARPYSPHPGRSVRSGLSRATIITRVCRDRGPDEATNTLKGADHPEVRLAQKATEASTPRNR